MDFRDSEPDSKLEIEVDPLHPRHAEIPAGMSSDTAQQLPLSARLTQTRARRRRLGDQMPPSHGGGQP